MLLYDLLIRGATVVLPGELLQADVSVAEGRIAAIAPEIEGGADSELDAAGLYLLPGVIDAHVHLNEPGRTGWEGFASGTKALAAGGATTYFDMPLNSHPPVTDAGAFDLKLKAARTSSLVDFGLWGGLVPGNLDNLDELAERGVVGFKAFMSNSGIDDFPCVDDNTLYDGMARAAALGCLVAVHAENDTITSRRRERAVKEGRVGVSDYLHSRPVEAELEAIGRAILFAEDTGCALHIVHVSSGRGVIMVEEARRRGVDVSCETCPHYLVLDNEDVERLGALAKCAPPIRTKDEQEALWTLLCDEVLPMVASDHSPAPATMKTGDFFEAWGGISGCQSMLPLLLTEGYSERKLPLTTVASVTAGYPAHRFRIAPRKGCIQVGADADFELVDLAGSSVLQAESLFYRHPHSPYIGRAMRGRVVRTMVRGITVFREGEIVSRPVGRLVRPAKKDERLVAGDKKG